MQFTWFQLLETRLWATSFCAILFSVIAVLLVSYAGNRKDRAARDRFWKPIAVLAELASALGVIAAVVFAAQYFVKADSDSLRESFKQATAKREGIAHLISVTSCDPLPFEGTSLRELSARSQLCVVGRNFARSAVPPLDSGIVALKQLGKLPASVSDVLPPKVDELARLLHEEIKASGLLKKNENDARVRPAESDSFVIAIAISVFLGATLKFSRALSEWRHRRDKD